MNVIDDAAARLGLSVRLYLVDLAQRQLNPVRANVGAALNVDTTVAGRAFRLVEIIPAEDEPATLWMPLLDGTERLGVVRIELPANTDPHDTWIREQCWVLTGLIGHLVAGKLPYNDRFHVVRRTSWRRPIQGLDLRILVHAQHQRLFRWVEVEADHIADLVNELRVGGQLEGLDLVRFEVERLPDPPNRGT